MNLPQRIQIRLERECYGAKGAVFHIVIRTDEARPLFRDAPLAEEIFQGILAGPVAKESDLNAVCLMPDHVHLLQGVTCTNLVDLVGRWKTFTTNKLHKLNVYGDIWQRSFHDHGMRSDEDLQSAAQYIVHNPVRAGLVESAAEYPYSWHKWMQGRAQKSEDS